MTKQQRRDRAIAALAIVAAFVASPAIDLFDRLYGLLRANEIWQLDELVIAGVFTCLVLIWYSMRRHREATRALRDREATLAEKTRLLQATFDHMGQGLVALDVGYRVVAANERAPKVLGLADGNIRLGADFGELIIRSVTREGGGTLLTSRDIAAICATVGTDKRYEMVQKTERGRTLSIRADGVPDDGCVITFTDITVRTMAQERMRHGQKLEALGQLAGGVSHEFNNLLTSIVGFARMGLKRPDDRERLLDCLGEVAEAADRATDLTRQMLTFSHKQMQPPSVVPVGEVIGGMTKLLRAFVEESVDLRVEVDDGGACAKVDPAGLTQCVVNLVSNARHAMPDGGDLFVRCDRVDVEARRTTKAGAELPKGAYVRITVSDTGTGIAPEALSKIFDPFFTTKEKGTGTGLGLAMVAGVLDGVGGVVDVESELGLGATFEIFLPVVDQAPAERSPDAIADNALTAIGGGRVVLVAEDDQHVRRFAKTSLQDAGFRVLTAEDGEDAKLVFDQHAEEIALLVTDVVMPKAGGVEVAKVLSARAPNLKVIYMSGYAPELGGRIGGLEEGTRFLKKPFDPDTLGRMAQEALAG